MAAVGSFAVCVCVLLTLALGNSFFCLAASAQLPFYFALCLANEWGNMCVHACVSVCKEERSWICSKKDTIWIDQKYKYSDNTGSTQESCVSLILLQLRQSSLYFYKKYIFSGIDGIVRTSGSRMIGVSSWVSSLIQEEKKVLALLLLPLILVPFFNFFFLMQQP